MAWNEFWRFFSISSVLMFWRDSVFSHTKRVLYSLANVFSPQRASFYMTWRAQHSWIDYINQPRTLRSLHWIAVGGIRWTMQTLLHYHMYLRCRRFTDNDALFIANITLKYPHIYIFFFQPPSFSRPQFHKCIFSILSGTSEKITSLIRFTRTHIFSSFCSSIPHSHCFSLSL